MEVVQLLNQTLLKNLFIEWLKEQYKCDIFSNIEYDILNIYTKNDYNFHETLPIEFQTLDIIYHFSDIIMTNEGNYIVGVSEYDPELEYITIKIKK